MRRRERRADDESSVHGGSQPSAVGVPPQGTFLFFDVESVGVTPSWFDWALCYVFWSIRPWIPHLLYPMPVADMYLDKLKKNIDMIQGRVSE